MGVLLMNKLIPLILLAFAGCPSDGPQESPQRVFLWGDSICIDGYADIVVENAPNDWEFFVNFWHPNMTAQALTSDIRRLDISSYTVFHMNVGLHGVYPVYIETPEEYEAGWRDVIAYIRSKNPSAPIVLATSTALDAGWEDANAITVLYNEALKRIAAENVRVSINDLRAYQESRPLRYLPNDPVHPAYESSERLAIQVQLSIQEAVF